MIKRIVVDGIVSRRPDQSDPDRQTIRDLFSVIDDVERYLSNPDEPESGWRYLPDVVVNENVWLRCGLVTSE